LGNPLCRGVDELCTELLNARDGLVAQMLEHLERLVVVNPFAAVGLYKGLRYPLRPVE
jgi:hypothetical protein